MNCPPARPIRREPAGAFTLVELMVSMAVLSLIVVLLASITNQTSSVWRRTTGKAEQFRQVRAGFEAMTNRLSQATLNTYWDYDNRLFPTKYERRSDLRFICGPADDVLGGRIAGREQVTHCVFFQAPLGITDALTPGGSKKYGGFENLLCSWGFYLDFGDDKDLRPPFITERLAPLQYRFRLMEFWQPAEENKIYQYTSGLDALQNPKNRSYTDRTWFTAMLNSGKPPVHVVAQNVIALIITPRLAQADEKEIKGGAAFSDLSPLAPNYLYDSSPPKSGVADARYKDGRVNPVNQLPPILQVTMVAIDENSAARLNFGASSADPFGLKAKKRFTKSADFTKDLALTGDAGSLENTLIQRGASYRIFTTNVVIRGAKWSREQTN
ncbi:MAG: hypothetical protein QOE70_2346 [Chthoniobacter sp.]|jgi:uncharacterized protein (TIGR02599 family)|nr:hypothetical protein [Chthoniobacter sp.]